MSANSPETFAPTHQIAPVSSDGRPVPLRDTPGPRDIISFDGPVDPLAFLGDMVQRYGDTVRYQTRLGPCILFVHPEQVQAVLHSENYRRASLVKLTLGDGLLASDGPFWRSQRRLMQREFMPARMPPFGPIITRETSKLACVWRSAAASGETIDVSASMTRLALSIIVAALFSEDIADERSAELRDAITQNILAMGKLSWTAFGVPFDFTPSTTDEFAAARGAIDRITYDMIRRRQAMPAASRPRDLLTLLIEAQSDPSPDGQKLTDLQLRDEVVTILIGGHETTALALAWAWKELAEHPECEATLAAEAAQVLGGRLPTVDDLPKLAWTRAIFQETLRLYPPVWFMGRVAIEDDVVDGHAIGRGTCVVISPWLTHRHKDLWPLPDRFDPQRFVDPQLQLPHRYAYFPFNGGRHQCLGMYFALMEGTMVLAQLALSFRLVPVNAHLLKPNPGITLRMSPGLLAKVQPRPTQAAGQRAGSGAA
jgi:cytochrome P450